MKKLRPSKNTLYDWLINYILAPIGKSVSPLKDKIASLYKSITLEQTVLEQTIYGRGQKLSNPKKLIIKKPFISEEARDRIKDQIIKDIWNFFETKEEKEERKRLEKLERKNKNIMKD